MAPLIDLQHQTFGRLTALKRVESTTKNQEARWQCICECGNFKDVTSSKLRNRIISSCGCLAKENMQKVGRSCRKYFEYPSHTSIYYIWRNMKSRCLNPLCDGYERYGGRGITIHQPWIDDYEEFARYVTNLPNENNYHSIDRIDNNANYQPGNLRWASSEIQQNNTSANIVFEHEGRSQTVAQWSRELEVAYSYLYYKLTKCNITLSEFIASLLEDHTEDKQEDNFTVMITDELIEEKFN